MVFQIHYGTSNSFIANLSPATCSVIVEDAFGCVEQFTTQIIKSLRFFLFQLL